MKWYMEKTAAGMPPKFAEAIKVIDAANARGLMRNVIKAVALTEELLNEQLSRPGTVVPKFLQTELAKVISAGELFARAVRATAKPAGQEQLDQLLQQLEQVAGRASQMANDKNAVHEDPFAEQGRKAPRRVEPTLFDPVAETDETPAPQPPQQQPMPPAAQPAVAGSSAAVRTAAPAQPFLPFPKQPDPAKPAPAAQPRQPRTSKGVFKPYLDNIVNNCRRALARQPVNGPMILSDLLRYYQMGKVEGGQDWYGKMFALCQQKLGPDNARKFIALIAATSPRTDVLRNLEHAVEAMNKHLRGDNNFDVWQKGDRYIKFMSTHLPNMMRAIKGEQLSGPKVRSFQAALMGDKNSVTLDTWMAKALGLTDEAVLADQEKYDLISDAMREVAASIKTKNGQPVTPRDFQAAVWTGIKKGMGDSVQSADPIDNMMEGLWDRLSDEAFALPAGNPFDFGQATASWVRLNCVLG